MTLKINTTKKEIVIKSVKLKITISIRTKRKI